jgi:hypothetical protein
MSGSAVLDTALGVVFVFLAASLIASGVVEWLSNKLDKRGEYLLRGLREMLDVPPAAPAGGTSTPAGDGLLETGSLRQGLNRMAQAGAALADELMPPVLRRGAVAGQQPAAAGAATAWPATAPDVNLVDDLVAAPLPDPEADPVTGEPVQPPVQPEPQPQPEPEPQPQPEPEPEPEPKPQPQPQPPPGAEAPRPWLADLLLAHPVVASLHRPVKPADPTSRSRGLRRRDMHLTSYLSAQAFARALLDMFVSEGDGETTVERIRERVWRLDEAVPGRGALLVLIREADGDLARLRRLIEHWYDEQMSHVTGWYKRWAQWRLFVVGGLLAVVANVSTIAVAQSLYVDQPVRQAVVAQAQAGQLCDSAPDSDLSCERRQLGILRDLSLPMGWHLGQAVTDCRTGNDGEDCGASPGAWLSWAGDSLRAAGVDGVLLRLFGWLVTAAAVSFGAPFWFDALSKLGSLRTAGVRPPPAPGS